MFKEVLFFLPFQNLTSHTGCNTFYSETNVDEHSNVTKVKQSRVFLDKDHNILISNYH